VLKATLHSCGAVEGQVHDEPYNKMLNIHNMHVMQGAITIHHH